MHVVEELGDDNLFDSKAKALATAVERADNDRCATCTLRAFQECAGKACPDDHPQCYDQIVANPRDPKDLKRKPGLAFFRGFRRQD